MTHSDVAFPLFQSAIGLLAELVSFDTTSRNSNLALIEFVERYLSSLDLKSEKIFNAENTKANLVACLGAPQPGGIVLSGHTDVVPVDGQDWGTDPFRLTEIEDRFYGRGTADMKSFLACVLALVPEFLRRRTGPPLWIAFSYDEEVGCLGAPALARFIQSQGIKPALAVIGEPTDMRVVTAHKGIHTFETVVTGYEAHSSAPEKGVNAVTIAAALIGFLDAMAIERRNHLIQDQRFDPPYTTIHVGVVHGGTARNIIPRECRFSWEIRPLSNEKTEDLVDRFAAFCQEQEAKMQMRFPQSGIRTTPISGISGLTHYEGFPGEHYLMRLTGSNYTESAAFFTEAGIFQQYGIPSIVCGPGSIEQAHRPNEFIKASQVEACLAFLQKLGQSDFSHVR